MDPISQGIVGALAAQQPAKRHQLMLVTMLGFLSGMAPDLDVLITSSEDPLLYLEYHRQFTHSLLFIPFGGLLCALFFHWLIAKRFHFRFRQTYGYCTAGYATHGLLDSLTSYGTQLLWPFSDMRVAWNVISIIDPLFTLPIIVLVAMAAIKRRPRFAYIALLWALFYISFGVMQRERAEEVGLQLANSRGHYPLEVAAKPAFANLIVWKLIYATEDNYVVDAVKLGLTTRIYTGEQIPKLQIDRDFPWLDHNSQQAKDIERFRWFSNDYLALAPDDHNLIIDMRYSMLPHQVDGLWGIRLDKNAAPTAHVDYESLDRRKSGALQELWTMIID